MRRSLCLTVIFLAASVATASAQKAAGTWNGKKMMGPKDSVVATYPMTIAAVGKTASM